MSHDPSALPGTARWLILVVEDDWLIGLDLAGTLEDHGFDVLGPAPNVAAALLLLEDRSPDAAVLDVNLGRELVTPVARRLHGRGVPFLLASSCTPDDLKSDDVLAGATNLGKPTSQWQLVTALSAMVGQKGRSTAGSDGRGSRNDR